MAPRRAGHVHDERRRFAGLRRRRREAAQHAGGAARGDGGRRDGSEAGHRDVGPGRAAGARASSHEAGEEVRLGPLRSGRWVALVVAGGVLAGACSLSPPSGVASPRPSGGSPAPSAPISLEWPEYHRDSGRSGAGPAEPALTTPRTAWNVDVDGDVYASPLIVAGHVIVATENNTVYSLDIFTGSTVWQRHFGDPVVASTLPCGNIGPVTGITGTPAADPASGRMYVVAFLRGYHHVLYALSLTDGSVLWQQTIDPAGSDPRGGPARPEPGVRDRQGGRRIPARARAAGRRRRPDREPSNMRRSVGRHGVDWLDRVHPLHRRPVRGFRRLVFAVRRVALKPPDPRAAYDRRGRAVGDRVVVGDAVRVRAVERKDALHDKHRRREPLLHAGRDGGVSGHARGQEGARPVRRGLTTRLSPGSLAASSPSRWRLRWLRRPCCSSARSGRGPGRRRRRPRCRR